MKNIPSTNNIEINSEKLELDNRLSNLTDQSNFQELDPYNLFIYSLRSPYTKESYIRRLKKYFEISGLNKIGEIETCCSYLVKNARDDLKW